MRGIDNVGFQRASPNGVRLAHGLGRSPTRLPPAQESPVARRPTALIGSGPANGSSSSGQPTPPTPPNSRRPRRGLFLRWAPVLALPMLGAIGALVAGGPAPTAVGVLVLVAVACLSGWRLGEDRRRALQREVDERNDDLRRALSELEIAQAETVRRLSMAVEFRDEDTGAHIERIGRFTTLLAEHVGMSAEFCRRIRHAAPLHDVGKVAIPDSILLKPGSLTAEERAIVETHAEEGHRLLRGSSSSILDMAATIALSHHERWDGNGYPRGLAGEEIPIEGRIVAIADVFDALTSDRVYREAFPVEQAIAMMRDQSGLHFDPVLLKAFMEVLGSSGADARTRARIDRHALLTSVLDAYTHAIRRGDAEAAEGAVAAAIEDGIEPAILRGEVIAPAMSRIGELWEAGEIDADAERLASSITRRVLATMNRYMLAHGEQ